MIAGSSCPKMHWTVVRMRSWLLIKMADALNIKKMKVAELKKELANHGLEIKGNKSELQERLKDFLQQQGLEVDHSEDAGDEEVEDELEHVTTGDDEEEEISDDVLAEESLEQKPNKVTPLNDPENKEPLPEVVQPEEKVETPIKETVTAKTVITKPSTEEERKLQRMKRFGSPASEENKKLARGQRFGSNITSSVSSPESADLAKLKKRAERFGAAVSPIVSKIEDQDRLLKRKERFGASLITADDSIEAKKKKRSERFST